MDTKKRTWNVGWGPISACNMHCEFCYSRFKREQAADLSYEDWVAFVDQNYTWINSINYGTGENSLSEKWFRLVAYVRGKYPSIRQAVTTNGHLSYAVQKVKNLEAFVRGIDEVDVSLDFCDKDRHNRFRGQPNAFDWAMDTLALCREYGKSATIVFLGSKKNLSKENIDGLFAIADTYGAILRMNLYRPTEGVNAFSKAFIAPSELVVETLKYIGRTYSIIALNDALFSPLLAGKPAGDPSGVDSIRILSDGGITPSTYLIGEPYIIGNIKEPGILGALNERYAGNGILKNSIPEECLPCIYKDSCAGGVLDRRYLWYGSLRQKDPYCKTCVVKERKPVVCVENIAFQSVHDGYLPTIFFKNREQVSGHET